MKDELLLRLESFELDEPSAPFPFSARLARENGWSREFSRRVIVEYKRFVWLAMRAGHPVTPSEEVDEAWHLHLCYTRSYWDGMCGGVLGKPLHHGPTEGGEKEDAIFADWYERTLESYRRLFGEELPADIWPPAEIRFRPASSRKIDATTHWAVPKRVIKRVLLGGSIAAVLPVLAGCSHLIAAADFGDLLCFLIPVAFVVWIIVLAVKKGGKGGGNGCGGGGCGGTSSGISSCGSSAGDSGSSGCSSSGCGGGGCGGGGD
ncbi:hypothetical protein OKA04_00650 [Luteolibacter flavescens]|uniref:TIGR04222 domain-containing membrane protein n=1 Tax=Luteolibacter flavescens TaxID=1859460 RepID=A0ABT3FI24_9BACT|nr:hypothetical protein [Luteolibacter flavescens]MCW1883217.1 hypothetical protein [Luteolibacter flavescens]